MPRTEFGFGDAFPLAEFGPTLLVQIGFDPLFRPGSASPPDLPDDRFPALVDTGALESCIDSMLAGALGLPVADRRPVAGVHGIDEVNMHLAQIHIPELQWTVYGQFAGVHLAAGGQPHRALMGRTFLMNFVMTYDGRTGAVALSND